MGADERGRVKHYRLACGSVGWLLAAAFALGPGSATAQPPDYCVNQNAVFNARHANVGITDINVEGGAYPPSGLTPEQYRDCSLGQMAAHHIGVFRVAFAWNAVETVPHHYDWSVADGLVADAARHGMTLLPGLLSPPKWATHELRHPKCYGMYPPVRASPFATFAALAAKRYGPNGTFWHGHRELPYRPVHAWQVWNEPSLCFFWAPAPNARAYLKLLRATYRAIKKADRHATVVMAGLPFYTQVSAPTFLTRLYRLGARGSFDAVSLHDYAPNPRTAIQRLRVIRRLMNRFHDRKASLWVTEMGWSSAGPANPYRAGLQGQGNYLARFFKLWSSNRRSLRLGQVDWYGWRDVDWQATGQTQDFWGYYTGLLTWDLTPKPALAAFDAGARRLNR